VRLYFKNHLLLKNLFLLIGILIVISGCDKELVEIDESRAFRKLSIQDQDLINSTNSLSLDIMKAEYLQNEQENLFFSPISVGMALGMVHNSVGEKEKSQIRHIMGLESLVEREINKSYNELLSFLQVSDNQFDISYANSLWFSDKININEDFRTRVMAYYDAEISELNFAKSSSLDLINSWGNLKSNGTFEKLINVSPSISTDIYLINAFSLNSNWKEKDLYFQSKGNFYTGKGDPVIVKTMNWDGLNVKIKENENYSFLEIPFENDKFFLSVVEPEEDVSLIDFIGSFTIDELNYQAENALDYKANVNLPKINFSADKPLKSTLSHMGLTGLFVSTTDLSPSFIEKNKQISEINHKAKINLNGDVNPYTEATGFRDSNLKSISINKPFLYFVREKHTHTVLFAGYYFNSNN
jgi:serpin B